MSRALFSQGQRDAVSQIQLVLHPCFHPLQCLHWSQECALLSHLAQGQNPLRATREVTLQMPTPSLIPEHPTEDPGCIFSDKHIHRPQLCPPPVPRPVPCSAKSMMLGSRASTSVLMSTATFGKSGARPMGWWGRGLWLMSGRVCRGGVCAGAGELGARRAWVWSWWCSGRDCRDSVMMGWGWSWDTEMWPSGGPSGSACLWGRLQLSGLSVISLSSSSAHSKEEKRCFNPFVQAGTAQSTTAFMA